MISVVVEKVLHDFLDFVQTDTSPARVILASELDLLIDQYISECEGTSEESEFDSVWYNS